MDTTTSQLCTRETTTKMTAGTGNPEAGAPRGPDDTMTSSTKSNNSPEDLGVVSEKTEGDTTTCRTETRETTSSQRDSSSTEEPPEEEEEEATPAEKLQRL